MSEYPFLMKPRWRKAEKEWVRREINRWLNER